MRAPASSCLFIRLSLDESWSYSKVVVMVRG